MNVAMLIVFGLSVSALVYTQFGYLVCLMVLSRIVRRPEERDHIRPMVSLIVPVHNGRGQVHRKIENMRGLDYPSDLLDIIIVDDCSTDATAARVAASSIPSLSKDVKDTDLNLGPPSVRLLCLGRRSGKAAALNAGLKIAEGEIIGFTDVGVMLEPDALAIAVERFADQAVGCVSGEDKVISTNGVGEGEGLYTRIDTVIRRLESSICSATGMSGSFYLVRRKLCPPFPLDLATDMFSALNCVEHGSRAVVESRSKVRIAAQPDAGREFERKVRTMVTGLRALQRFKRLLNPLRHGFFSLFLTSHKLLRYLTPVFVVMTVASSAFLSRTSVPFRWLLSAEMALMGLGVAQIVMQSWTTRLRVSGVPAFFCAATAAAIVGWYRYLRGERYKTWQPTKRSAL